MIKMLEMMAFRLRPVVLGALVPLSLIALWIVLGPRPPADPARFLPLEHPYLESLAENEGGLPAGRLVLLLEARQGTVWTEPMLRRLQALVGDIAVLPGIVPQSLRSILSPDVRYLSVTDDGIAPMPLLEWPTRKNTRLPAADLAALPGRALAAGVTGHLVSADGHYLLASATIGAINPVTGERSDPNLIATILQTDIVPRYSDAISALRVLRPLPPPDNQAARGQQQALAFLTALVVAGLLVPLLMLSLAPGLMALIAVLLPTLLTQSLLRLSHFPFDAASFAAPFAVYALGLGQAVRVLMAYEEARRSDHTAPEAARLAMMKTLPSGALIFAVALLVLATLYLIAVPLLRELAESAALGTILMALSVFVILPLLLSVLPARQRSLTSWLTQQASALFLALGKAAAPRHALVILAFSVPVFLIAAYFAGERRLGEAPDETTAKTDTARLVATHFPTALNELTLILHTPDDTCLDYRKMKYLDDLAQTLRMTPGIHEVRALPLSVKLSAAGWNEANPKWYDLPRNRETLAQAVSTVPGISRLMNEDCTRLAYRLYLQNAQAPTIATAIATIKAYVSAHPHKGITFELASGPLALAAAENETLVHAETSILGWVSLALVAFLVLAWRDWRAATLCLIPLIYCAALGYGFMGAIDMALTMPVLPAMALALAVGIGLILPPCMAMRAHLAEGRNITDSCRLALGETGLALTIGVLAPAGGALIWFMSPDPLMADLGLFFAVMFLCEALAILILMPALAAGLELAFPRRPGFIRHKGP